jgi:2-dehydro-3-deoxyphosphogalactonate aldolase
MIEFEAAFAALPLVAILRGIRPDQVEAIGDTLIECGFRLIEVPLNSPTPLLSIEKLAKRFGDDAMIGAGTVLHVEEVARVREAGGRMVVSPNTDVGVIKATVSAGMTSLPGYFTPSDAFSALSAGANALKLFPAEAASPAVLRAHRAVLPQQTPILAVGGITPEGMAIWRKSGADGFGLGSALYKSGASPENIRATAKLFATHWRSPPSNPTF